MNRSIAPLVAGLLSAALFGAALLVMVYPSSLYTEKASAGGREVACSAPLSNSGTAPEEDSKVMPEGIYYSTCGISNTIRTSIGIVSGSAGLGLLVLSALLARRPNPPLPPVPPNTGPYGPGSGLPPRIPPRPGL